ncbi:DUF4377 domain-containing protein [Nannocystaceae bacterium ST9]
MHHDLEHVRKLRGLFASVALSSLLFACDEPSETEVWDIHATPSVCDDGVDFGYCDHYTVVETGEVGTLYQDIEGFTPEWGHTYRIEVEVVEVDDPPADGSSLRYVYVAQHRQRDFPGLEFDLDLRLASVDAEQGAGQLGYHHGVAHPFTCTPEQCADLAILLEQSQPIEGVFRFGPAGQMLPLELVSFALAED